MKVEIDTAIIQTAIDIFKASYWYVFLFRMVQPANTEFIMLKKIHGLLPDRTNVPCHKSQVFL